MENLEKILQREAVEEMNTRAREEYKNKVKAQLRAIIDNQQAVQKLLEAGANLKTQLKGFQCEVVDTALLEGLS